MSTADRPISRPPFCLWGNETHNLVSKEKNMVTNFQKLQFGAPHICKLDTSAFFVSFWAVEECIGRIKWCKLKIN